jgi:hypothetical protein
MKPQDLSAKIAADLGLPEASERDSQQRAVLALVMEALRHHNPPTGPDYGRIVALGRAALTPEPVVLDGQDMQRCTSCGAIHDSGDDMCARCQQTVRLVSALGPDEYRRRRTARTLPDPLNPDAVDAFLDDLSKREGQP